MHDNTQDRAARTAWWAAAALSVATSAFAQADQPRGGVPGAPSPAPVAVERLSDAARQQIQSLLADKQSRTAVERKISSRLLYRTKARVGARVNSDVAALRSYVPEAADGRADVEIMGLVTKDLIEAVEKFGGEVIYGRPQGSRLRAHVPYDALETLAALSDVRAIRPTALARTQTQLRRGARSTLSPSEVKPGRPWQHEVPFERRASNVRTRLRAALDQMQSRRMTLQQFPPQLAGVGTATTQGEIAHKVEEARNFFGVTGAGVKIGVLSDSVDFLARSIANGDLPPDVVVLPGQSGVPGSGEGTAMLEIIHDLAPGADLFFATAFISEQSFADNIVALRAAGCDVIVDDVLYAVESPFHDNQPIAQAVREVVTDGAVYFSSASNDGNFNDGTSSVWEGDFKKANGTIPALGAGVGELHDFGGGVISNRVESPSGFILGLYWSDPMGGSSNDYDFFILDNTLTEVHDASTDVQDGDDDPFEGVFPGAGVLPNERVVIVKVSGERRALHLNNYGGQLGIATSGSTHGHNSVAGAFGTAAVNVATAAGGPFTGGPTNPVELFSSDGFRRVFYDADGNEFRPGRLLFSNRGGALRRKPDLTAADGVQTSVPLPFFQPFFGTSAAAPHGAAIAGLLKSARPQITLNRIRRALTQTALDIEAFGRDRDSGYGIIDAFAALSFIGAAPQPFLELGEITSTAVGGDGDAFIEPGESANMLAELVNVGGATALNVMGTLSTMTPGVTLGTSITAYPNIGSNGQAAVNPRPYTFRLATNAACGLAPDFTLTAAYSNGTNSPQTFNFRVPTGQPGDTPVTVPYTGAPTPIPDNNLAGVNIPFTVAGATGAISDVSFSIDGTMCSTEIGSTTVGLAHTWVGDLAIRLTSPSGTTVALAIRPGGPANSGNNFCNTVLDDGAATSIQAITAAGAPYTGSFRPASPLSALVGEDPNGSWTLNVSDLALFDAGIVRAFSLTFTPYACSAPTSLTTLAPAAISVAGSSR